MNHITRRLLILQHLPHEDAGTIYTWAAANHYSTTTLLFPADLFPPVQAFDVLIILGGTIGVYEEHLYPWMKREEASIGQAIDAGKWVIGICLGAQLLAATLGSNVYPHRQKEIGFFPVYKTLAGKSEAALQVLPESWTVFHWHGDTFDLPPGAQHLLYSQACAQQAFRKDRCWGFQFHPEINAALLRNMLLFEGDKLQKDTSVQTAAEIEQSFKEHPTAAFFHAVLDKIVEGGVGD